MDNFEFIFTSESTFMNSSVTRKAHSFTGVQCCFILCSFAVWLLKWSPATAGKLQALTFYNTTLQAVQISLCQSEGYLQAGRNVKDIQYIGESIVLCSVLYNPVSVAALPCRDGNIRYMCLCTGYKETPKLRNKLVYDVFISD